MDPSAPPPLDPPTGTPPVLLTRTWRSDDDTEVSPGVQIVDGRLRVTGSGPGRISGQGITAEPLRDGIVDTVVRVTGNAENEGFGVFCRQSAPGRYIGWRMTSGRLLGIGAMDGTETVITAGTLAEGMVLHTEPGKANRFTVVTSGPALTMILNGLVLTSVVVDTAYVEGHAGVLLEQRSETSQPQLEVEWFQVRALLPPD